MSKSRLVSLLTSAAFALSMTPSWADTLTDALIKAYQLSPVLEASRAGLRAVDEGVAIARAARRATVNGTVEGALGGNNRNDWDLNDTYSVGINAQLTVYDGGQTRFAVESARASVSAGRNDLRATEQNVLLDAVSAFMNVRRDTRFVDLARNNVRVLREQVRAARDRFEVGEVTRTDVSLAEAALAAAQSNLAFREGQLNASKSNYRAVVGVSPNNLQTPPALPNIPASLEAAQAIAMRENPSLIAARFDEISAEFDLKRARAAKGPSATLSAGASRGLNTGTDGQDITSAQISLQGNLPIYTGGRLPALQRQAAATLATRKAEVQNTARVVRQNTADAWSNLQVARATVVSDREQVRAAQVAFDGVQEEATLGARTTLDVLDTEQDLRDAQVQLVSSLRDEYVAAYSLLSAMGLLSVEYLGLGIPTYDPDINYQQVQNAPISTVRGRTLDRIKDRYQTSD